VSVFLKKFLQKVYICPDFFALKVEGFLKKYKKFQKTLKKCALPLGIYGGFNFKNLKKFLKKVHNCSDFFALRVRG
jgi:hypothetical protein